MDGRKHWLFTAPGVSGLEAVAGRGLALVVLGRLRQQILPAVKGLGAVEPASDVLSELAHLAEVAAVHVRSVDEGGDLRVGRRLD